MQDALIDYLRHLKVRYGLELTRMEEWPFPVDSKNYEANLLSTLENKLQDSKLKHNKALSYADEKDPNRRQQIIEDRNKEQEEIMQ